MNFRAGNDLLVLSPQQIVSCDTVDAGCDGGDTISAYQYVEKAGGIELNKDYPYTSGGGNNGKCSVNPSKFAAKINGSKYATPGCTGSCNGQDEDTLAANLVSVGPISICVNAEPWQTYVSGILKSGCPHAYNDLDHCVQLVGYNFSGATPYWIIRNSWNTDWGVDGYIYVAKGSNLCGVADEATYCTIPK
jgi:cathepsin F